MGLARNLAARTLLLLGVSLLLLASACTPSGGGSESPSSPQANVPGVTGTKIFIGEIYTKNQGTGNAQVGAGGLNQGDARDPYNVMINEINGSGGLDGRELAPVYFGYDATSSQTADQQDQAACAQFTQDHQVFLISDTGPIIDQCASKAGAVQFGTGGGALPETYQQYPHRVDIDGINMVRMGQVTVDGLAREGYFPAGSKVGLVTWDDPRYREGLGQGYVSALRKAGATLAASPVYLRVPQTSQELGQTSADASSAVLRFESQGVDRVLLLDGPAGVCGGACVTLEFLQAAKSQKYYPRYGFNDSNSPAAGLKAGIFPTDEMRHSIAVGWTDLNKTYDEGWHLNPQREKCYALMRRHSIDMSNPNSQSVALAACSELWFIQAAVNAMGNLPLTPDNFMTGVDKLGYDYSSPSAYSSYFGPNQHDGIAAVRTSRFDDTCTCFTYTSVPYRVG